jgi:predicted ribosomally synthesized peptide with SipW-like signal peptide|tara:strand:+ start:440 stop:1027 length:588 start_codon:yes stop_codon:yes gene_type:complete
MEKTDNLSSENRVEWTIAALIAILSILTASNAYYSDVEDSNSNQNYFTSQSIIVEANSLYLEANQAIIYDLNAYDSYYLADLEGNDTRAEFYFSGLSDSAVASFNRSSGPFDDQYYDEMYSFASEREGEGIALAEKAEAENKASDEFQLAVLFSAVGLSLTGWASVISSTKLKFTFMGSSVVALGISVLQSLSVG